MVLDASVMIALLDVSDRHHAAARDLLLSHADSDFVISSLTLAEVLVGPTRTGRLSAAIAALQQLGIETLPLTADGAVRLATLRTESGLRLPDCCVLLAAEHSEGPVATFDQRLAQAARSLRYRAVVPSTVEGCARAHSGVPA